MFKTQERGLCSDTEVEVKTATLLVVAGRKVEVDREKGLEAVVSPAKRSCWKTLLLM